MEFLSAEWLSALDDAARSATADPDLTVTIEHTVATDDGEVAWALVVEAGRVRIDTGPAPDAEVRLATDRITAAEVAAGRMSAQRAFLDGRIRVGGDVDALRAARSGLEVLGDVFAAVRAETAGLG